MKRRSLVVRLGATAMSAALALIAGMSGANANSYTRMPYPTYYMWQTDADTPVQKYHWVNGGNADEENAYRFNVNICALDGQGGSRKVGIWQNITGIYRPTGGAQKNSKMEFYLQPPKNNWTYVKTWSIPICGKSSGGGGNPRAANGGLDTGSNGLGKGVFWFKITRIDDTSPTVFCIDSSFDTRSIDFPDEDTKHECVMGGKNTPYMGWPVYDVNLNK